MEPLQVFVPLWVRVDLGVIVMKEYSTFPTLHNLGLTIRYSLVLYPGHFVGR